MKRRLLLLGLAAIAASPATSALADYTDDIVAALRKQGYVTIEVSRTFLGRTRILAKAPWGQREVILNPRTGEILRDILTDVHGNVVLGGGVNDLGGSSGGTPGSEGGDDGDDDEVSDDEGGDEGEEEEDDDEAEKSGHG